MVQGLHSKDRHLTRVLIVCLGDISGYGPRLDFAREYFAVGGFDLVGEGFHTKQEPAVKATKSDAAATIVLVGLDDAYADLAPAIVAAVKMETNLRQVIVAGLPDNQTELKAVGVDAFITNRSDVVVELTQLVERLEVS